MAGQDSGVAMVDELVNLHPHQLTFSEASLRLLITPHFPPSTRLHMAGRMVISEVQPHAHTVHITPPSTGLSTWVGGYLKADAQHAEHHHQINTDLHMTYIYEYTLINITVLVQ